jgi:phage recombination protein Bet
MSNAIMRLPETAGGLTGDMLFPLLIEPAKAKLIFNANYLALLRDQNKEVPTAQFIDFLHKAQLFGADPRRKQIFLISYKTKKKKQNAAGYWEETYETNSSAVFAYQFFLEVAEKTGERDSHDVVTTEAEYFNPFTGERFPDLVCVATVRRKGRGDVRYTARLQEFASFWDDKKTGTKTPKGQWASKPYLMLEKCALANAYRLAFPEWMAGMYVSEEMEGIEQQAMLSSSIDAEYYPTIPLEGGEGQSEQLPPPSSPPPEAQVQQPAKRTRKAEPKDELQKPAPAVQPTQQTAPIQAPATAQPPNLTVVPPPQEPARGIQQPAAIQQAEPTTAPKSARPPSPVPPQRTADQTPASQVSKNTLWKLVGAAAAAGKIDSGLASKKLAGVPGGLTEAFCLQLTRQVNEGNLSWFQPAPAAPADEAEPDLPF